MYQASFSLKEVYLDNPGHAVGSVDNINAFISAILPNVYVASGLLLLLYAVFGGFTIISSAGNMDNAQKGKQILTNAIIGFIIIFASYWIIQLIQILTGITILGIN